MPFTVLNIITEEPIAPGSELTFDYPADKGHDRFLGASMHTLSFEGTFYRAPKDFVVIFGEQKIHVYWNGNRTIPNSRILTIQLDEPLSGSHQDLRSGQIVPSLVRSQMFIVDLGRPTAPRQEHFASELRFEGFAKQKIAQDVPLAPMRNITLFAHDDVEEGTTATVRGLDLYNRPVTETITLKGEENAHGVKCFRWVWEVELNRPTASRISIGIGERLGLPVFLPGSGYVMKYFVNSRGLAGGTILPGYEQSLPNATTPDVRGCFTPPEDIAMDGHNHFQLLVSLFNSSNIGLNEYADFAPTKEELPPLARELDPAAVMNAPLNQTPAAAMQQEPTTAKVTAPEDIAPPPTRPQGPALSMDVPLAPPPPPRPEGSE